MWNLEHANLTAWPALQAARRAFEARPSEENARRMVEALEAFEAAYPVGDGRNLPMAS